MGDSQGRVMWLVSREGSQQEASGQVTGWPKGQDAAMGCPAEWDLVVVWGVSDWHLLCLRLGGSLRR